MVLAIFDDFWRQSSQEVPCEREMMFEFESLEMSDNIYLWPAEKKSLTVRGVTMSFIRESKGNVGPEVKEKRRFLDRLTR